MSGKLAPSRSTIYVSNIPFTLTNCDLYKIFEKYGQVVKVTIVKDKQTRKSKGVAFVLFLNRDSAYKAVQALHRKQMFGRTIQCSIAVDNGRASEFIRRKTYTDKSKCYECGDSGHLSYNCPKNALGDREPPKKKERKRKKKSQGPGEEDEEEDAESEESEVGEDPSMDTLSAAIRYQQEKMEEEEYRYRVVTGNYSDPTTAGSDEGAKRKKIKKDAYFSDEEEVSDS